MRPTVQTAEALQDKLNLAADRLTELVARTQTTKPPFNWETLADLLNDAYRDDALEAGLAWFQALPPAAGEHLAVWLRRCGDDYRSEAKAQSKWPPGGYTMLLPDDFEAAVAFADLVLAGSS